ncbi:MAG: hypothetical protein CL847_04370 [Crocinitomicaceae bacterium]|nr:hypothetical protein [Crocinitomicaceae bacterium]|tara:strand:+ start:848 stop:1447 length:600 start_codon:yes stop_codon:yes gene_type:complete
MREIKVGDRVKFLNDVGEGVVIELKGFNAVVEDKDGFDRDYPLKDLISVRGKAEEAEMYGNKLPELSEILARDISEERQKKIQEVFEVKYANARATNQKRRGEYMEVDLHFHELVDDISGLKDRTKLDIQLNHFERMMRIAAEQKIKRIVFIHGVGQGVLRHQLRSRLDMYYPECTVRDANPREYGAGATEVYLGQSSF